MMTEDITEISISDNFGRRSGFDRREMLIPSFERAKGDERERRVCKDRRVGDADRRNRIDRRSAVEKAFEAECETERERRSGQDRRVSSPHYIANP